MTYTVWRFKRVHKNCPREIGCKWVKEQTYDSWTAAMNKVESLKRKGFAHVRVTNGEQPKDVPAVQTAERGVETTKGGA